VTRAVIFDVDGVLVHGYHARPERTRRWDENLLADLGVDPDRFREEFIFDIFITRVVTGPGLSRLQHGLRPILAGQ
jgi:putative hydrolase of the HAD superfamily